MKTFAFLILLLIAGLAVWKFGDSAPFIPDFGSPSEKTTTTPSNGTISHIVVKGDTLHSLAKRHNTTVASIQQLNNISGSNIRVGQKLTIRSSATSSSPAPLVAQPKSPPLANNSQPKTTKATQREPLATPPAKKPTSKKPLTRQQLPKTTVMESSRIAIDIDDRNQVYLKRSNGTFAPAGSIIYGSDADKHGNEIKTTTYRDLSGKETTLTGHADPEAVIRLALKKKYPPPHQL